ncbi:PEP-CTERM sorting domain-containing protein [Quisquiliibacterium transsilvanicum]|uniref:Ice-binding protein C-terminal domain-containing protein n=1 Tax=Quisquiliibacterium transsilvanicum TaxID=1549638 RepID=A0A7W8HJI8_9BURK|nr:PEP-CTERM sorting domain-containing protein [Quisquiliibacterium transsilvanicum]MBB5273200.1 hypothetical protein [Quisquiliibacterium transsilvanicum]
MKRTMMSLAAAAMIALPAVANAINVKVTMTVDNSYALFYGTGTQATNFVGADYNWQAVETYNFDLPADRYLYVVTASDLSVAQGFLGQFENLDSGYKFYSNDPQWQVMATGLGNTGAPYSGSVADLALLSQEIQDANGGGNVSQGWTGLTAGPGNGSDPWGSQAGIDAAARWVWYSANGDTDPTSPGFNHGEWLVFRIAVASTPTEPVPLPGTVALLGAGLAGVGLLRRRPAA